MIPFLGSDEFHDVRDSIAKVRLEPSGVTNKPIEYNSAISPGIQKVVWDI